MRKLLSRRRIGTAGIIGGVALIAVTALVGFTTAARGSSTGTVFLVMQLFDGANGQLPTGSHVTLTATVSNSSVSGVGDATPTVDVSFSTNALSFDTFGAGWTCSTATVAAGFERCTDGTLTAGGGTAIPLVFSVVGNPGNGATVTATVNDTAANLNSGSFTGLNTATDSASVANGASYTKDVPAGGFPSKVGLDQLATSTIQTYTFIDSGATVAVRVPPGSLADGTHISVYRANPSFWSANASSASKSFVDGYAVAWTASGNSTGTAALSPVTLTAQDSKASAGDTLYRATTSGIGSATGAAANGSWSASFTGDPGFLLLRGSSSTTSSTTSSATTTTTTTTTSSTTSSAVGHGPDLIISSLSGLPASLHPGATFRARARTKNAGDRPAGSSTTALYLWFRPNKGRSHEHKLGAASIEALAPGRSANTRLKLEAPSKLKDGDYRLMACADSTHKVTETSETNNCRLSTAVVTIDSGRPQAASLSGGPRAVGGAPYVVVTEPPGSFANRAAPILMLLGGVLLLVIGTVLVGLRRREAPGAFA